MTKSRNQTTDLVCFSEQSSDGGGDEQRDAAVRAEGGLAPPPLRLLPTRRQGRGRGARKARTRQGRCSIEKLCL